MAELEIQNYELFARMYRRMQVIASGQGSVFLSQTINPVIEVSELLRVYTRKESAAINYGSGASTELTPFTVDKGERWTIRAFSTRIISGDNEIVNLRLNDISEAIGMAEVIQTAASTLIYLPHIPVVLEELDSIGFTLAGSGVSAGTAGMAIDCYTEAIHATS